MLKRYLLILVALSLLVLLVPSCGGGGKKTVTTLTPTSIPTVTPVSTPTPLGSVKIGAITSWSGPAAISGLALADPIVKLVEKQVKDMGGILGGRDVQVASATSGGAGHSWALAAGSAGGGLLLVLVLCLLWRHRRQTASRKSS